MANLVLNSLLKEYEQKKLKAEMDAQKRRDNLYKQFPRLQEIENRLNHFAIQTAKNILVNNNNSLNKLNQEVEILKREKLYILKEANLSLDDLNPYYDCFICCDTGYVSHPNKKSQMCNCLKQKLLDISFNKSNMANLNKENFDNFNSKVFSDEVDIAKYRFNISPRQNIENIKKKCLEFVEHFDDPNYKNLLFTGNTGLR